MNIFYKNCGENDRCGAIGREPGQIHNITMAKSGVLKIEAHEEGHEITFETSGSVTGKKLGPGVFEFETPRSEGEGTIILRTALGDITWNVKVAGDRAEHIYP